MISSDPNHVNWAFVFWITFTHVVSVYVDNSIEYHFNSEKSV